MNSQRKLTGQIVLQYLEKFPTASSLGLARKIYDENPLVFTGVEHARTHVRNYRGSNGEYARGSIKHRKYYGTCQILPEGEEQEYRPYELPKANNRILFMSDIHLPFHDLPSIRIALDDAKDKVVNTVILGGDIVDMYDCSVFDRVPTKSAFLKEREMFWQLMDDINATLPAAKVFWIEGNHEYRFYRYMLRKAIEVFDVDDFQFQRVFSLRELGVEYINRKQFIKAGHLNIMHGHEFGMTSSVVNPARGMYLKAQDSVLFGHLHKTSEHNETDIRGRNFTTYSCGCLCYLHPSYMPLNKWNIGFALVEVHPDGSFMVKNKKIVGGKIQ